VDAVAGAVAHFQRAMMMDVDQAAKAMRDAEMEAEIEDSSRALSSSRPTACHLRIARRIDRSCRPGDLCHFPGYSDLAALDSSSRHDRIPTSEPAVVAVNSGNVLAAAAPELTRVPPSDQPTSRASARR
jgi:hypothetical protein